MITTAITSTIANTTTRVMANPMFQAADLQLAQLITTEDASAIAPTAIRTEMASTTSIVLLEIDVVNSRVNYGVSQPPTRDDEQCVGLLQAYVNVSSAEEFGITPRSTHASLQPRTHWIVVSPGGDSTTISKSGPDVCAFPAAHPRPTKTVGTDEFADLMQLIRERRHIAMNVAGLVGAVIRDVGYFQVIDDIANNELMTARAKLAQNAAPTVACARATRVPRTDDLLI